jgi:hypothetical protein
MRDTPTSPTVSYRDQYTLGGLLLYAAIAPAVVVALTAPVVALAFAAGVLTALAIGRMQDGGPGEADAAEDTSVSTQGQPVES